ncbi:MAG: nucleotidyltransferase family protein [Clostridia bacterium]|nr:nucleotidyltransferase family protein [Clostridia bacterium]
MQALILAGGLGTRLRPEVNDRPKPMALAHGKPFLEYQINHLRKYGLVDIVLAVGFMHEKIEEYFKDGEEFGVSIKYSIESEPMGTGGALKKAEKLLTEDKILILNGDTLFDVDYKELICFDQLKKSRLTMALRQTYGSGRYGHVEVEDTGKIIQFVEKGIVNESGYINAGIYLVDRNLLNSIDYGKAISFEKEVIPRWLHENQIYGFIGTGYFIDIGIPEDYKQFCRDVKEGRWHDHQS